MGRKRLNTGQVSVPGSGDTIHDGGNKLHDNFNELFQAFGDQRLSRTVKNGTEEWITPHATGYFQHLSLSTYASAVPSGSMHDIDSSLSAGYFPVILPIIGLESGKARRGEKIIIQDSKGSWDAVKVRVSPSSGQAITGSDSDGNYILNESKTVATFTVIDDSIGTERWGVKLSSIDGNEGAEVSESRLIPSGSAARIDLHNRTNYNSIKVLCYVESRNIDTQVVEKRSTFEMHIMNTPTEVISSRYAVLNTHENDSLVEATPVMYIDAALREKVAIDFLSTQPSTNIVSVTVKSAGSIKQKL